jgi:hypothetical protein
MTTKVKIFTRGFTDEADELENQINDWLAENPGVGILDRQATSASGTNALGDGFVNVTVLIWYRIGASGTKK